MHDERCPSAQLEKIPAVQWPVPLVRRRQTLRGGADDLVEQAADRGALERMGDGRDDDVDAR